MWNGTEGLILYPFSQVEDRFEFTNQVRASSSVHLLHLFLSIMIPNPFTLPPPSEPFLKQILPKYFPYQTKIKSFQRQLHLYGFVRIRAGPEKGGYSHDCFRKGHKTACLWMCRTKKNDPQSQQGKAVVMDSPQKRTAKRSDGKNHPKVKTIDSAFISETLLESSEDMPGEPWLLTSHSHHNDRHQAQSIELYPSISTVFNDRQTQSSSSISDASKIQATGADPGLQCHSSSRDDPEPSYLADAVSAFLRSDLLEGSLFTTRDDLLPRSADRQDSGCMNFAGRRFFSI